MARCARSTCGRWWPGALVRRGRGGLHFDGGWYCSSACLEAEAQGLLSEARHSDDWVPPPWVPIGRLLIQRRAVSASSVAAALVAQRASGRKLGAELVAMRATTPDHVVRALAAQAGTGCLAVLDAARVTLGPGGLSRRAVELLRIVPFDANPIRQRLAVACAGPLPRRALAAIRRITGWEIRPFVVSDTLLERLIEAYGSARPPAASVQPPLRSLAEAAASIAQAARQGLARRMHHVWCDSFVWIRLEGETHAEDFMVTFEPSRKEDAWQAVPTPH